MDLGKQIIFYCMELELKPIFKGFLSPFVVGIGLDWRRISGVNKRSSKLLGCLLSLFCPNNGVMIK
jgi:hypothetical protein